MTNFYVAMVSIFSIITATLNKTTSAQSGHVEPFVHHIKKKRLVEEWNMLNLDGIERAQ